MDNPILESTRRNPEIPLENIGYLLAATNHELRALIVGRTVLEEGPIEIAHIIEDLRKVNYDLVQPIQTNQVKDHLLNLPDEVIDKRHLADLNIVTATEETFRAASLGGLLLEAFGRNPEVKGLRSLVGNYVIQRDGKKLYPGPASRFILLDRIIEEGPSRKSTIAEIARDLEQPDDLIRNQLDGLVRSGFVDQTKVKNTLQLSIPPEKRGILREYRDLVRNFMITPCSDSAGYAHMRSLLDPAEEVSITVPFLVRRSIATSNRDDSPVLDAVNHQIIELRRAGHRRMTTTEIAEYFGFSVSETSTYLNRIAKLPSPNVRKYSKVRSSHRNKVMENTWEFSCTPFDELP